MLLWAVGRRVARSQGRRWSHRRVHQSSEADLYDCAVSRLDGASQAAELEEAAILRERTEKELAAQGDKLETMGVVKVDDDDAQEAAPASPPG